MSTTTTSATQQRTTSASNPFARGAIIEGKTVEGWRATEKLGDPEEWPADLRVREFPRLAEGSW